jgi:hypothetical protein
MKKIRYAIPLVIFSLLIGFTSCLPTNPSYWGAWGEVDGYMIKDSEDSTTRHFEPNSSSITDKTHPARMYTHEYSRTPSGTLVVQEWPQTSIPSSESDITYQTKSSKNITFLTTKQELNGFIYYKDTDNLYVINTLYNYEAKNKHLKDHVRSWPDDNPAAYRFKIKVDGIFETIEILMDDNNSWD